MVSEVLSVTKKLSVLWDPGLNVSLISIEEDSGEFTFLIKNSAFMGDI